MAATPGGFQSTAVTLLELARASVLGSRGATVDRSATHHAFRCDRSEPVVLSLYPALTKFAVLQINSACHFASLDWS